MRNVILQLFLDKYKVRNEIEELQSQPLQVGEERNHKLIEAKHKEWDRIEHLIDLFFQGIGM